MPRPALPCPDKFLRPALALAILLLGIFCWLPDEHLVDYLSDDAYYYLRVATHLAAGNGPTFDGITVTTGFHPLYPFVLAGFVRLFSMGDAALLRFALVFNALCHLLTALCLHHAARRLWGRTAARWAALFWLANGHALLLVATGMEAPLYGFLVAAFLALLAQHATSEAGWIRGAPGLVALGSVAGLAVVARTDGLVLVGLAGLCVFLPALFAEIRGKPLKGFFTAPVAGAIGRGLLFGGVALIPFALWLLYARHHTGSFLQASAEMKQIWREQATRGMDGLGVFLFSTNIFLDWTVKSVVKVPPLKFLLPFAALAWVALGAKKNRDTRGLLHLLWLLPVLLGLAYAATFPKAWTWYYAPGMITLTLFAAGAMVGAAHAPPTGKRAKYASKTLPFLLLFAAVESYGYLGVRAVRGRNRNQRDMLAAARWISENVEPGTRAAAWNSGIYSWYSGLTVINLDGLINNEIGPLRGSGGRYSDYLRERGVEIIVDRASYLQRHIPEWTGGEVERIHLQDSPETEPVAVWRVRFEAE